MTTTDKEQTTAPRLLLEIRHTIDLLVVPTEQREGICTSVEVMPEGVNINLVRGTTPQSQGIRMTYWDAKSVETSKDPVYMLAIGNKSYKFDRDGNIVRSWDQ
ncbi:MAG: hypothetical protein Q8L34_03475 [Candidatus Woesearchaeota archaeon]|nr:hypothetical protein [Candidatus Woesearchaeota archaeon]